MAMTGRLNLFSAKTAFMSLCVIWIYAFWATIKQMCLGCFNSGYDYQGFLVLPMILLYLRQNSANLKRANPAYNAYGLLCMLFCALAWLVAIVVELDLLKQAVMFSMMIAIVFTTCGKKITSILFLPLASLFLLLPLGQTINAAIQESFAWLLMQTLMLAKQAVYWEANQIVANNHAYDIPAYLSSMRFCMSFVAVGYGAGMLRTKHISGALTIAASFALLPLIMLWIVLSCYILLSQLYSNNLMVNHLWSCGWILTSIGLTHAVIFTYFMRDRKELIPRQDNIDWRNNHHARAQKLIQPLAIGGGILLLMPLIAQQILHYAENNAFQLLAVPTKIAACKEADQVKLTIAHNAQKMDLPWKKLKEGNKQIKLTQQKVSVHETVFHNDKNKYKVQWQLNYVNGHFTNNTVVAKALTHFYNLSAHGVKTGIITMSTDVNSELSFARDRLKNFLQDFTESDELRVT